MILFIINKQITYFIRDLRNLGVCVRICISFIIIFVWAGKSLALPPAKWLISKLASNNYSFSSDKLFKSILVENNKISNSQEYISADLNYNYNGINFKNLKFIKNNSLVNINKVNKINFGLFGELIKIKNKSQKYRENLIKNYLLKIGVDLTKVGIDFINNYQVGYIIGAYNKYSCDPKIYISKNKFYLVGESFTNYNILLDKLSVIAGIKTKLPLIININQEKVYYSLSMSHVEQTPEG